MVGVVVRRSLGSRPWTLEELQQLRELAAARAPTNIIARKLKRTSEAIRQKAKREGIVLAGSKGE
jgi:hypothetical protein